MPSRAEQPAWTRQAREAAALQEIRDVAELGRDTYKASRTASTPALSSEPIGWVYFIAVDDASPVKVGWAANVETRLSALQVAHWRPLSVIGRVPGPRSLEADAHYRLQPHRVRGEWFEREPALALLTEFEELRAPLRRVL